jgi:hypothetical protein
MPTPTDLATVAQLRARALHLLEMADKFPDDPMCQLLREQATELDKQATALERKD